ncbi:MAG: glycosyltransferase family 1 protein [Lachnospiraceae bacterium]|nr:glycosyltransferase family 1 protein [Lachnospiraceae bacterium]
MFLLRQVEVWDYFAEQMIEGARAAGADYYVLDMSKPETLRSETFIRHLQSGSCVLFLIHQRSGMETWARFGIPVYNFIQDHPRLINDILSAPMNNLRLIVLDHNHEEFIRELYPHIQTIHFMPNGGTMREPVLPYAERDIDVLYTGNCQKEPDSIPGFPFLRHGGQDLYEYCIPFQLEHPGLTTEEVIKQYLADGKEGELSPEQYKETLRQSARIIEDVARRHYKQQIMRALDKAGITVEVYGENWEDDDYTYGETIHFHPRVSSAECNRLAGRSRISLNIMPWFKDGCSERVFNNMLNGALCITDPSGYLLERFPDRKELVYFDMERPDELVEIIRHYLDHPDEAAEIASRGRESALANDTWAHRFEALCRFVEEDSRS